MYSLLVTFEAAEQSEGTFVIERDRFLEGTDDNIKVLLQYLSNEAKDSLCSWPCILMQEGRAAEIASVVVIEKISATKREVTATLRTAGPGGTRLTNDVLWKLRVALEIEQFEFSRNHWAVKDRDLFEVFEKNGVPFPVTLRQEFTAKPLPVVRREDLLRAGEAIAAWGHSKIEALILEAGIDSLHAGKELGGRKERAQAIVSFVLKNPGAVTAENSLFSLFLVGRTLKNDSASHSAVAGVSKTEMPASTPTTTEPERHAPNRVFVVHGQNDEARTAVVSFLESIGLRGIVLHEQPNMGRHLLTKFVDEAELVTFAVVLMTDDDVGRPKNGEQLQARARQNVILELGYFLAHLGQPKVCALISPGLETPSDFDGIVYIKMAEDQQWKRELLRELKAANMPVTQ